MRSTIRIRGLLALLAAVASSIAVSCRSHAFGGSTSYVLAAVPPQEERIYGCIDPFVESMTWRRLTGELVSVDGPDRFTLKVRGGRQVRVFIANIGAPAHSEASFASDAVRELLYGKEIEVLANWPPDVGLPNQVTGEVHTQRDDVAERLLVSGIVPFVKAQPYQLSQFSECVHRNAEAYAKKTRRGRWSFERDLHHKQSRR